MIPDLGKTLQRYLDGLKAVIPSAQYEQTKKTVEEFAIRDGPVLQQELIAFAAERENWVSRNDILRSNYLFFCYFVVRFSSYRTNPVVVLTFISTYIR